MVEDEERYSFPVTGVWVIFRDISFPFTSFSLSWCTNFLSFVESLIISKFTPLANFLRTDHVPVRFGASFIFSPVLKCFFFNHTFSPSYIFVVFFSHFLFADHQIFGHVLKNIL